MKHLKIFDLYRLWSRQIIEISGLSLISSYIGILIKIKEAMSPIIKTAGKAILTPIKTPKIINKNFKNLNLY